MPRAFVGQPADARGNALPCDYCDRVAIWRIGPKGGKAELLCSRHDVGGSLKGDAPREAEAARRARATRRAG